MKEMTSINIDKWRRLDKTLFDGYINTYAKLSNDATLKPEVVLLEEFEKLGIKGALKAENYGTAYTIAREIGIYYQQDGKHYLSQIAKDYINKKLTYADYLKYYCLNIEFYINKRVVHPFQEIVNVLANNSFDKEELAQRLPMLITEKNNSSAIDCLRIFLDRIVEAGLLLSSKHKKYSLAYSHKLILETINRTDIGEEKFLELFINTNREDAQKNVVKLILEKDISNLFKYFNTDLNKIKVKTYKLVPPSNPEIFDIKNFQESCKNAGLVYKDQLITRFVSSLLTKPFVILTGLSGSGKTKLAQAFVQWICQEESQYRIIPVGADWTNREPLLGYPNALKPEEYVKPDSGVIDLILQANSNPELPHFLILDEMNLSHVERYFADFLSVMESNEEIPLYADGTVDNGVPSKLKVPANLFIIGTVNIDETTNMFSPKVLDRANTIEFRINNSEMEGFLGKTNDLNMKVLLAKGENMAQSFISLSNNKSFTTKDRDEINKTLLDFFGELQKTGAEFGYRSATEILRLINQLDTLNNKITTFEKIDIAIMQKLLPKLHGSRRKLSPILETLGSFCVEGDLKIIKDVFEKDDFEFYKKDGEKFVPADGVLYPLSLEKISRMYKGAIDNGFTSFAEA